MDKAPGRLAKRLMGKRYEYSVNLHLVDLSWVDFDFWLFDCLPNSAWADGNLAEAAGKDGETPKSKPTHVHEQMGHTVDCSGADSFIRVYRRSSRGTGAGPAEARVQGPELAGTEDAFPRRHPLPPQGHQHQRTVPAHQAAQHVAHRGGLARQMAGQRDSSQGKRRVLLIIIAYWTLRLCEINCQIRKLQNFT